ncbi:hypothetical protein HBN50_06010 [Halobacteriovorax sp. GB3]|uniref:tetratricopeptide repeat protein n=1 Tax=Halobacteriovorax sp. GB3 TaxID=2719615 RepID=UPI00235E2208|nr:hypothetical protein [Halobacteriovorax sp. GB3]MDD0852641.1 hypothetical protein [Halobacteriovorax sp. GB3]
MRKHAFKLLTFLCLLGASGEILSKGYFDQIQNDDFLRLSLHAQTSEQLIISRKGSEIEIKTLDLELLDNIVNDLKSEKLNAKYFSGYQLLEPNAKNNVPSLKITLASPSVELFSFYKEREKKKVLDFWIDSDSLGTKTAATKPAAKVTFTKPIKGKKLTKKAAAKKIEKPIVVKKNKDYRDFRYGASFIWDYEALSPRVSKPLNIERKTPEYFYPVANREFNKSEKEAHLQLAVNLFRKKKWGLMYKSLRLFVQKYGEDTEIDLIEYLKANAILRENLEKGETEPVKMAISMFQNIFKRSEVYDMRKGVGKYLLTYYLNNNETVQALDLAKKMYVDSKENFDYEESDKAAEYILYTLAKLNQVDKVRQLVKEKTIIKLLPKQVLIAYEMFSLLKLGKTEDVLSYYNEVKNSLTKPVHEAILFNVAEAYFREANYEKAVAVYDSFLAQHSYHIKSSEARLRIALAYDLLDREPKKVEELYKNAINRSQNPFVSYEARIRYVAHRSIRKNAINDADREVRVFLDNDNLKNISYDLKKLLWLTRLRTFIKDAQYTEALSFLTALPLKTMKEEVRRVYEGDGAEIVYGIMMDNFEKTEYSKVYRAWEIYKDSYISRVATDPYLNYIVAKSLLKLNFNDLFEKFVSRLEGLKENKFKSFPVWVSRATDSDFDTVISELRLLKQFQMQDWDGAWRSIASIKFSNTKKKHYYQALIHYHRKNFDKAEEEFEKYLTEAGKMETVDSVEVAKLLKAYTDSIYEQGKADKFVKVTRALLSDTESLKEKNKYVQGVRERMNYLLLEMVGVEMKPDFVTFSKDVTAFKKDYPQSQYLGRINYLFGINLVKAGNSKEGREVFEGILKDTKSSEYLKEMARTELSLLAIKDRKI